MIASEPEPDFSILHCRHDYYSGGEETHPTPADWTRPETMTLNPEKPEEKLEKAA
jgi:hypothetical protein